MASLQCHKPANETSCQQKSPDHSLGQKISEITGSWFKGNNHPTSNQQTHYLHETSVHETKTLHSHTTQSPHVDKTKGDNHHQASNGRACLGKTVKKRNLFQRIKDGFSSDDSSGSDSESDNEGCHKRKN